MNWAKKVSWSKTSIFSILCKFFKNEENHHIFTLGQLKHKNSLVWMKTVHMCELNQKGPQVRGGRKLQFFTLRKHAYSNILKISLPKIESFPIKIWYFSYFCRSGSNEYPQSMFLSRNINNVYPCQHQFYYIKGVGFKGIRIIKVCFRDEIFFKKLLKMKKIIILSLQDN